MQFEISGRVLPLTRGFGEAIDLDAATPQRRFERNAILVSANAVCLDAVGTGKGGRSQQASAEARAFFVGPVDQANRYGWTARVFVRETAQDFECGQDVQTAVEPAAVRHRIEMPAKQQRLFRCSAQGDPTVARGVQMMFHRQAGELGLKPLARLEPDVGPGNALSAVFIARQFAQFFQFGHRSLRIQAHNRSVFKNGWVRAATEGRASCRPQIFRL